MSLPASVHAPPPTALCRDCGWLGAAPDGAAACPACASPRLVVHGELAVLGLAHVDCDAFYASVEKRDRPALADKPLIVGGGVRGVVTTACYIARRFGVRSAMPMSQARRLCPDAVVLPPEMEKYRAESAKILALMQEVTPVVEQVSIDEAYLDLAGLDRDEPPARALARLQIKIEKRLGLTVSIGLGANRALAKIASDLGKPRGFHVIGAGDAAEVLAPMQVRTLPGVGPVMAAKLAELGIHSIEELRRAKEDELIHRFGVWARRLVQLAWGRDDRPVAAAPRQRKSVGAETTYERDLTDPAGIRAALPPLVEQVAARLRRSGLAATGLTLKIRYADWRTITRACPLHRPTQRAERIAESVLPVLAAAADAGPIRLIGVTAGGLVPAEQADAPELFEVAG